MLNAATGTQVDRESTLLGGFLPTIPKPCPSDWSDDTVYMAPYTNYTMLV